ncbi:MAG: hypothetical protein V4733_06030 [Verrucomicrobiota bacterium]
MRTLQAAYLLFRVVPFPSIGAFFFGGFAGIAGISGLVVLAAGNLAVCWLVMWFLWRNKIFFACDVTLKREGFRLASGGVFRPFSRV